MTTVVNRLDEKLHSFKGRKNLDRSKAITGHYGIQSRIHDLGLGGHEYSRDDGASGAGESSLAKQMIMANKSNKNAELRNKNMKHEIMKMKKRLETAFDIDTITTLENKIQVAEADIAELTDQNS